MSEPPFVGYLTRNEVENFNPDHIKFCKYCGKPVCLITTNQHAMKWHTATYWKAYNDGGGKTPYWRTFVIEFDEVPEGSFCTNYEAYRYDFERPKLKPEYQFKTLNDVANDFQNINY